MPLGNGTGELFSQNPAEGSPALRSGPRIGRDDRKRGTSACTPATSSRSEQFSGPLSLARANLGRWTLPSSSRCRGSGRSASCVPTWGSWLSTADRRTGAPRRWRGAPRSGRARPTTPSSSHPTCGSISPHGCTTPTTRRLASILEPRGHRHLGARVRARRLCPLVRRRARPHPRTVRTRSARETDWAIAGDHPGRVERSNCSTRRASSFRGASPATTLPTSAYDSGFTPTTRSTFRRPMASRSSSHLACAESVISARYGFHDKTRSSLRWWLHSSIWRHGRRHCCVRRAWRSDST